MSLKYISPLTDWGFKKLFGEESSKNNLISFLNAVFHDQGLPWIENLELKKTEHLGNTEIDRTAVFDLYCQGKDNQRFIIELQKIKQKYFIQRSLFYSTFAVQDSATKGTWNFKIDPVYVICILDFKIDDAPFVQDSAKLIYQSRQSEMIDGFQFFFLECPKIQLELEEHSSKRDKWLYIFKYLEKLSEEPSHLIEPEFKNFLELAGMHKLKDLDKSDYNASVKYRRDLHNLEVDNLEKGRIKGLEQGLQQGKIEGKIEAKIKIAKNMLAKGLSIEMIAELTDLSIQDIRSI